MKGLTHLNDATTRSLTFIIPCFNASQNLPALLASFQMQKDADWRAVFIDDMSTDGTGETLSKLSDDRVSVIVNSEKKHALRNIVEVARTLPPHSIAAVVDGDDELASEHAAGLVRAAHDQDLAVVWTAHRWDINGLNISKEMPSNVNPYQHPWCSSHLRTFDVSLLDAVSDANFKDHLGRWFERGYDQALMLPLLFKAAKRVYIPDVCYLYKINSCSVSDRDWAEMKQLRTVNLVRARGFIDGDG